MGDSVISASSRSSDPRYQQYNPSQHGSQHAASHHGSQHALQHGSQHGSQHAIHHGSQQGLQAGAGRGYTVEPSDVSRDKPRSRSLVDAEDEDDVKISYSCLNASVLLKASSACMWFSFVLQAIAVGAPYWSVGYKRDKMNWYEGVWMTCYRENLDNRWICGAYDYGNKKPGVPAWYTFCQAMGLISIVIFLPALMINMFYTMHPKGKMFKGMRKFNFVLTFLTGLIPLMMWITWIAGHPKKYRFPIPYKDKDYDDEPFQIHVCWVFEIFACIISFAAFGLEVHDYRTGDYL